MVAIPVLASAIDGFVVTQGVAVAGSLYLAAESASAAGMAKLFAVVTQAFFCCRRLKINYFCFIKIIMDSSAKAGEGIIKIFPPLLEG